MSGTACIGEALLARKKQGNLLSGAELVQLHRELTAARQAVNSFPTLFGAAISSWLAVEECQVLEMVRWRARLSKDAKLFSLDCKDYLQEIQEPIDPTE